MSSTHKAPTLNLLSAKTAYCYNVKAQAANTASSARLLCLAPFQTLPAPSAPCLFPNPELHPSAFGELCRQALRNSFTGLLKLVAVLVCTHTITAVKNVLFQSQCQAASAEHGVNSVCLQLQWPALIGNNSTNTRRHLKPACKIIHDSMSGVIYTTTAADVNGGA